MCREILEPIDLTLDLGLTSIENFDAELFPGHGDGSLGDLDVDAMLGVGSSNAGETK